MVAYISRLTLPDPAANAIQTLHMASALAQAGGTACLFVHDLSAPEGQIRQGYGLADSRLKIWPLRTGRWPTRVYDQGLLRFTAYNTAVASILGLHPLWRKTAPQDRVIFVRSRLETLYWGRLKPYLWGLRDWLIVAEIHDLPVASAGSPARAASLLRALRNYDLVLAVTQALAQDIRTLSYERVRPVPLPLCTGLPRLAAPPGLPGPQARVIVGYLGTLDRAHGLDDLFQALDWLPPNFILRLVGRVRDDLQADLGRALETGRVEHKAPVPYSKIAAEIDACDIVLAPAGTDLHSTRYRSPLKIFDYLARARPLIAADVPCHRELLQDRHNALLYRPGDPQHLAGQIRCLASQPHLLSALARAAWQSSGQYTYEARARSLRHLCDEARAQKDAQKGLHG